MGSVFNPRDPKWIKETQEIMERTGSPLAQRMPYGERIMDIDEIYSYLLKERIVFIGTPIYDQVANSIVAQLLYLQSEDATKDINVYINSPGSPGGSLYIGLGIYDTMEWLKPDVSTVCVGMAMSVAAVLLAAGTKGKRFCLPNSTVIIHQPLSGIRGQASDIEIHARELVRQRHMLYEILAKHTGQTIERITQDADRINYLSADQAAEYGIIDEVLAYGEQAIARWH